MPCREVHHLLAVQNADPDVDFRQIAQGHRQGTLRVGRRPHVGEVRVDLAVVFLAADPRPLERAGLNHGRQAVPPQDSGRVVGVIEALTRLICQPADLPLDFGDDLASFSHQCLILTGMTRATGP